MGAGSGGAAAFATAKTGASFKAELWGFLVPTTATQAKGDATRRASFRARDDARERGTAGRCKNTLAPPLRTGSEAVFRIRLEDLPGGKPVTGALVDIAMQRKDRHGDSGARSESKLVEGRAQEGAEKGVFFFRHTFAEHGWYEFVFTVQNLPGSEGKPVSLIVQKEVAPVPSRT